MHTQLQQGDSRISLTSSILIQRIENIMMRARRTLLTLAHINQAENPLLGEYNQDDGETASYWQNEA
jgi:hypothetical protein